MNTDRDREDALTLEILDVIERQKDVSQRHLARHLGVALGLTNSYLKRCIRKGLVKVRQAPANRYLYYLTPQGFAEKSRLTAQYLSISLSFYRKAGESCLRVFDDCTLKGRHRLLLCGVSDLAEIATLRAMERDIDVIGYLDSTSDQKNFLNRPVWQTLGATGPHDACLLTELQLPQACYQELCKLMAEDLILVPDVLAVGSRGH